MWGLGHRDLLHKTMQALRAFRIFLAESPLFLRVMLFRFLGCRILVLVPMGHQLIAGGTPSLRPLFDGHNGVSVAHF